MRLGGIYGVLHPRTNLLPERCEACGKDSIERRPIERTRHAALVPLTPKAWHQIAACASCKRVSVTELEASAAPRRTQRWRMAVGWALIAAAIASVVVGVIVEADIARERAAAPEVGDVWTIRTSRWHFTDPGALEYGRMIVTATDADGPTLSACDYASNRESTIEDHCKGYPTRSARSRRRRSRA